MLFCVWRWGKERGWGLDAQNLLPKLTYFHLLHESPQNFEGHIDKKIYQNQKDNKKIFNCVTNFIHIGPSKAEIVKNVKIDYQIYPVKKPSYPSISEMLLNFNKK